MTEPSKTSIDRTEIEDNGDVRIVRHWHPNGTLVEEERCKILPDGRFLLHGTSRRWSSDGVFIGSFEFVDGTGTQLIWYDNGQIAGENPMVAGALSGLQRGWDEAGYLLFEKFWFHGEPVAKKHYRELQQTESDIPKYDDAEFMTIAQKRKRTVG